MGAAGVGAWPHRQAPPANALPEHIAEARAAGMDDHLAKPIHPEALIGLLSTALETKAAA